MIGLLTAWRITRRAVRKAIKRPRLWINAWQYKRSEKEVCRVRALRASLVEAERREHVRQVEIAMRRSQIAGW